MKPRTIIQIDPICKEFLLKITMLKSMMNCGELWGAYHKGWAMMRDHEDCIFPFWLNPLDAQNYAQQHCQPHLQRLGQHAETQQLRHLEVFQGCRRQLSIRIYQPNMERICQHLFNMVSSSQCPFEFLIFMQNHVLTINSQNNEKNSFNIISNFRNICCNKL